MFFIKPQQIPFLLIFSRLVFAGVIPILVWLSPPYFEVWISVLIVTGLLTDVFDGIIARRLGVSNEKLRVWDSNVDQIFWISIIATVSWVRFLGIQKLWVPILIIALLEGLCYLVSLKRFKKPIATHSILAKFWTLTLMTFLLEILLFDSNYTFWACFTLGFVSRLEILGIIIFLKDWATDVPSIFAVRKLNRGIEPKKNKWFNG